MSSAPATPSTSARPAPRGGRSARGNYSVGELRRIKGMKTAAVREAIPRAAEEAIHRDNFVLD